MVMVAPSVMMVAAMIFLLLLMSLGSAADALLVFTGVPHALTGGIATLMLPGFNRSVLPFQPPAGSDRLRASAMHSVNQTFIRGHPRKHAHYAPLDIMPPLPSSSETSPHLASDATRKRGGADCSSAAREQIVSISS
jgi:hypothetical protein